MPLGKKTDPPRDARPEATGPPPQYYCSASRGASGPTTINHSLHAAFSLVDDDVALAEADELRHRLLHVKVLHLVPRSRTRDEAGHGKQGQDTRRRIELQRQNTWAQTFRTFSLVVGSVHRPNPGQDRRTHTSSLRFLLEALPAAATANEPEGLVDATAATPNGEAISFRPEGARQPRAAARPGEEYSSRQQWRWSPT